MANFMEKKIRWIALFLCGAAAIYWFFSVSGKHYLLDIIADFVVYRPSYLVLYFAALLAVIVLPLFSEVRLLSFLTVFITAWLLSELVFKNGIEVYLKWSLSLGYLGKLVIVFVIGGLLLANVAKSLHRLPPVGVFLIALIGVFSSFLPNAVRLANGIAIVGAR